MRPAAEAGVIYDIGYQRYEGARLGRGYAFRTLFVHSLRQAWGLGRGGKALIIPFLLLFLICMPALLQALLDTVSRGEAKLLEYATYFRYVQPFVVLFCAAQAPELVSTDQHHRVLPLYFSRPLRRADYAGAKLLAMATAVWLLVLAPMLLLFVGRIAAAPEIGAALRTERGTAIPVLASTLIVAAVMGSLSVALASFTSRRALASAAIFGSVILTATVSAMIQGRGGGGPGYSTLMSPLLVLAGVIRWLFDAPLILPNGAPAPPNPVGGLGYAGMAAALVVLSSLAIFARYSRVRT
jgi:ABC-2 type transport system permease protein